MVLWIRLTLLWESGRSSLNRRLHAACFLFVRIVLDLVRGPSPLSSSSTHAEESGDACPACRPETAVY